MAEFGKQISLIKDCKTSWNRHLLMLQQLYLLKNCLQNILIDISLPADESFSFSNNEVKMIPAIVKALVSIKATVKALYYCDENLFTADFTISFMLKKVKDANHFIS